VLKREYQLLLLAALVLGAFYPSVLAGVSQFDDPVLFKGLEPVTGLNLHAIFFPGAGGGYYYRPLIGLSFVVDKLVLGLYPGLMHIENILLHLINTVLVYYLAFNVGKAVSPGENKDSLLPMFAAMLFGLHSVNAESVNWISGRTDLLAGVFVLSSALFLLKYREHGKTSYIVLSLIAFLGGVLSKETSFAFIPCFLLLLSADGQKGVSKDMADASSRRTQQPHLLRNAAIVLGVIAIIVAAVLFRSLAYTSNTSKIGLTVRIISADWLHSLLVVMRSFGFYMKKIVFPYPLNFATMEVDPLYEVLAVPLAALCIYIALRRTVLSAFFTTGVLLILPAFILVFGQIAWTPYAERYLYLSTAFIIIAAAGYTESLLTTRRVKLATVVFSLIAVIMFATTLNRSVMWQNGFLLVQDTVEKSPWSRDMKAVFASLLIERGDYDQALTQVRQGRALSPPIGVYDDRFDMYEAYIAAKKGRIDEAINLYKTVLQNKNWQEVAALQNVTLLLQMKKGKTFKEKEQRTIDEQILSYDEKTYNITRDPYLLYKLGCGAESLGEYRKAMIFFQKTVNSTPASDPYKQIAMKRFVHLASYENNDHVKAHK